MQLTAYLIGIIASLFLMARSFKKAEYGLGFFLVMLYFQINCYLLFETLNK